MGRPPFILPFLVLAVLSPSVSTAQDVSFAQAEAPVIVPEGLYPCENDDPVAPKRQIQIENEGNYSLFIKNDEEKIPGLYSFKGGRLQWVSGALKGRDPGRYEADGMRRPLSYRLTIRDEVTTPYQCRLPPPKPPKPAG